VIGEIETIVQFYSVKSKKKIGVPQEKLRKVRYERKTRQGTRTSYALRAEQDGQKLTKFVSKEDWEKLDVPQDKVTKVSGTKIKPKAARK
jgi:hypothetical protein